MITETLEKDELVESLKASSKREFEEKVRIEDDFSFDVSDLTNSYSGNPELWSIWYSQILKEIFEGTENILLSPICTEDATVEESLTLFSEGLDKIIEKSSKQTESDTTPLVKSRRKITEFQSSESGSITLIVQIAGGECEIQCVEGFISEQNINFEVSEKDTDSVEESALREHSKEVIDFFNSRTPYRHRPQRKYRRTLSVSIKKTSEEQKVTVGVDELRTRSYSLIEKIISKLGQDFSSMTYEDF